MEPYLLIYLFSHSIYAMWGIYVVVRSDRQVFWRFIWITILVAFGLPIFATLLWFYYVDNEVQEGTL